MSDGIEALSEVARDADAARERMAELLRKKGPQHVEALERRIERELDEVNESIQRKRRAVEEEVEYVIRKYGPEASAEEREEAARQVVRGFGSDLFTEAMRALRARAEEATESSRRAALGGRHGHARRLVRTLYQKKDERDDLKFRLEAVRKALRAWAAGKLDEGREQPVEDRPDVEAVARLMDPSRRLEYIGDVLLEKYDTWEDRYEALKAECERLDVSMPYLDVPMPYTDARSMANAYRQYVKRQK